MPQTHAWVLAAVSCVVAAGCADDTTPKRPPPGVTGATSTGTGGVGGTAGAGGMAGAGGATGGGGVAGMGGSGASGGGGAGGSGGAGGGGPENCYDGVDNDGDQQSDCLDTDCAAACSSSCANPVMIADPTLLFSGDTSGHADEVAGSCSAAVSGSEIVYQVTAAQTGMLDVVVQTQAQADFTVSLRSDCSQAASEVLCIDRQPLGNEYLSVPITQGDTRFVVVEGRTASDAGAYNLYVESRPIVCGDGFTDQPGEQCDDGNLNPNDGCDASCQLEGTEVEPNNTSAQANPWSDPFFAGIFTPGDVDIVSFAVPAGGKLRARTFDLGDGACAANTLDSVIDILGPDGTTVVVSDDNGGAGSCSDAFVAPLPAGQYFVRVSASPNANPASFSYRLAVELVP